tara:strand:- start:10 stop:369 length:360 start_codon:yes stop_codon:yes gene_type:complete
MSKYIDTATNYFSNLYTMFKTEIQDIELTPANAAKVLSAAMRVVEVSELKGEEQKLVAKELVRKAVNGMEDDDKKTLFTNMLDNNVIEDMVETIILATKGELQINDVARKIKRRCCPFF